MVLETLMMDHGWILIIKWISEQKALQGTLSSAKCRNLNPTEAAKKQMSFGQVTSYAQVALYCVFIPLSSPHSKLELTLAQRSSDDVNWKAT